MSALPLEFPELDFARDPIPDLHQVLTALRAGRRVAPVRYHGQRAFMILRYGDVQEALADEQTFPSAAAYLRHSGPVMGKTIQCMGGAEHKRNRNLVSVGFRPRIMRGFVESFLTPVAHKLVDELSARGEADLVADYTTRYAFTVISRLLDLPPTDEQQLKRWGDGLIDFPWNPELALQASREFTAYLEPIIDSRREAPGEDLLSQLATAEIEGERLSDEEIFSFVRLLFPAGADTTYRGLGSMLFAVLTHPEVHAALRRDPGLIPAVVQESLRWESPTAILPRFAPVDVHFAGADIPGGSEVLFAITSGNRDADVFPDPDRFDPGRGSTQILSFGHGQHFCLGSHLARREMEVSLGVLIERLDDLRLIDPERVAISGTVLRGPARLPVRFRS
jgi:cytochrome P450